MKKQQQTIIQDSAIYWANLATPSKKLEKHLREKYAQFTGFLVEKDEEGGCKVLCTDGRRLHIAKIKRSLPEGYWRFSSALVKANNNKAVPIEMNTYTFPDYKKVIPEKEYMKKIGAVSTRGNVLTELTFLLYRAGIKINIEYIKDLCSVADTTWEVYAQDDSSKAVLFESKDYTAVVMPLYPD